jgi:hypothetical protein
MASDKQQPKATQGAEFVQRRVLISLAIGAMEPELLTVFGRSRDADFSGRNGWHNTGATGLSCAGRFDANSFCLQSGHNSCLFSVFCSSRRHLWLLPCP